MKRLVPFVVVGLVVMLLAVIFWSNIFGLVSRGSLALDPSLPGWAFAFLLFLGCALLGFVFLRGGYYFFLSSSVTRHPRICLRWALGLSALVALLWVGADIAVYYFLWKPWPTQQVLSLLYPEAAFLGLVIVSGIAYLVFDRVAQR